MAQTTAITEGFVPFRGHRTWYRVDGERAGAEQLPVLLVHGGPGIPSDCLEPLAALAATGRPVVFYDQLGCGNSDRPDDPSLWSIGLFLDELGAVRSALDLGRVHLLGFSWGGALAIEYALTRPAGLASLVLHSAFASARAARATEQRAYDGLPPTVREALRRHEAAGTTDSPAYQAARQVFDVRHVCRIDPFPPFLQRAIARANWAVAAAMEDRADRHAPSGRKSWDVTAHLGELRVPTLVLGGRHDGFMAGQDEVLRDGIPGAEWVRFEASSHYAHAEEPERFLAVLDEFLGRVERAPVPRAWSSVHDAGARAVSIEENKAVVRRWTEARNANDLGAALALWADDQRESLGSAFEAVSAAFPDVRITPEDLIAEGDRVALRWTFRGTHRGPFQGIPATGTAVSWTGIDVYTVVGGKIASLVREADTLGLLQQLGAIPAPGQVGAGRPDPVEFEATQGTWPERETSAGASSNGRAAVSAEGNKAIVRRLWDEVWNRADLAVADQIFDDVYAAHEQASVPVVRAAFPDSHHTIEELIAEGDKVVTRFTWRGTHRGEFMGVASTGRRVAVGGIWIHRLAGGRIVEGREWGHIDWLGLLRQLGASPHA